MRWVPALVILRIERAAMDVKWSPDGVTFDFAFGLSPPQLHFKIA